MVNLHYEGNFVIFDILVIYAIWIEDNLVIEDYEDNLVIEDYEDNLVIEDYEDNLVK